jgi:hypothetical protein
MIFLEKKFRRENILLFTLHGNKLTWEHIRNLREEKF